MGRNSHLKKRRKLFRKLENNLQDKAVDDLRVMIGRAPWWERVAVAFLIIFKKY